MQKIVPPAIIQFLKVYFTAITFFTIFRAILFLTEIERITPAVDNNDIFRAFIMGIRFDIAISSYILILPFLIISIASFWNRYSDFLTKVSRYYIIILFSLAFLVCTADIPYFNQFFSRFSVSAFEWADSPAFVLKMIIQEPRYWLFIIPFLIIIYLFAQIVKQIFNNNLNNNVKPSLKITFCLIGLGLIFIGIRGRLEQKSPLRVGTAYFSNNSFLNQLGLNPNFTLIRSYLDSRKEENKKIQLMDDSIAISNVQKFLNIPSSHKNLPLGRNVNFNSTDSNRYNVVLVIMESMSAAKMQRHGNTGNLTPFLDSISNKGYYFENTYSSGIHTYNGIFSTLFSYPALFRQHPMKESSIMKYHGIYNTLKEKNYSTIYFTTHDGQFDNVEGFLKANDCETVISKSDYPSDKVKTTLGVPDDFMFEFSIPILNKLSQKEKPFFATFMTASDHGPYYVPDYFKPKNTELKKQIVEYADYSLRKFINLSSKQKWFKNTIFVFIADHGAALDGVYSMPLSFNHVPLLFYAPHIFKENKILNNIAGQIDVYPTIMGLLKLNYVNNTLGIDLLREERPYIFFNGDDKYGVIDNEWFLIVNDDRTKSLYRYKSSDTHNYASEKPEIVEKMNIYAQSNLQAFQYIIKTRKQSF